MNQSNEGEEKGSERSGVGSGYAQFQIAKAAVTADKHEDPETRARAQKRIAAWREVLNGIADGTLNVGSRAPLDHVPVWATLEVVTGGFATGELLAGGPLLDHERDLLAIIPAAPDDAPRNILNNYYLTDEGLSDLFARLDSGRYKLNVPEEGALLMITWLIINNHVDAARDLFIELNPWFGRLRFYPVPSDHALAFGSRVVVQNVGKTIAQIQAVRPNNRVLAQKETANIWAPLYDRMVAVFLETVEGEPPNLRREMDGTWHRLPNGGFPVEGGWPCRHYPEDWKSRAMEIIAEYPVQRWAHKLSERPERKKGSFHQLYEYLIRCVADPASLTGRDVGRIRMILARSIAKRGVPGSPQCGAARERQIKEISAPTVRDIADVVMQRLEPLPPDGGVDDIDSLIQPITVDEARKFHCDAGQNIPEKFLRKIYRSLNETAEALIRLGVITSGDVLAGVLPQMTSGIRSAGISDPALRHLYGATYRAFRRRRSLLLLNLEHQVQIEELPWVAAIDRFRNSDISDRELARQTLTEISLLTITSFPHAILPNTLIDELQALAKTAELELPLVKEIAVDIFMGKFSGTFLESAKQAGKLLEDSLYAAYYGIDYRRIFGMTGKSTKSRLWFAKNVDDENQFVRFCESLAGVTYGDSGNAVSGMVIEQQQILTTQNLAVLYAGLDLAGPMSGQLDSLAQNCFLWICSRLQVKADDWHPQLIRIKNAAYAWRQMIFFLSLFPKPNVETFLLWADDHLNRQPEEFRDRFRPALRGLEIAAQGRWFESNSETRRFLGWSNEKHWLINH